MRCSKILYVHKNNMFKNYQSAMKQLNDLLLQQGTNYDDDFDRF